MNNSTDIAVSNPFSEHRHQEPGALTDVAAQRELAEVQAAVVMARRFPRDPMSATDAILRACTRKTLAETALYSYSRGGTEIAGPSIRLAEAIAQVWGNLAFGIRELEQRAGESTIEAYCWDLETNIRQSRIFQVRHERYTKAGSHRLTDPRDVYEMTANQGARRLRACILGVIPGDVTEAAVEQCETTLQANADTSPEAVKKLVEAFTRFDVTKTMLEVRIQRRIETIRPAQIIGLRKIWASLNDNMSAASDWFEMPQGATPPAAGNEGLRQRLRAAPEQSEHAADPASEPREPPTPEPEPQPELPEPELPEPEPPSPPAEEPPVAAGTIPVVMPQRSHPSTRRRGWNWPGFADELINVARHLEPEEIPRFRGVNSAMINSLQQSDKEQWSRVQQALAKYEQGEPA
jgi:hypothetical protein